MAIFHLSAKVISRGKGQSAIAAAAYRSGERLRDEQSNEEKFYRTRAERIMFTDIMAPKDAPEWAHDRNQLWNQAERAEKRKDAQLAREIEISLPHELTEQQREWLVKDFAREVFVRHGYAVDIAIHAPDRTSDERNHHAHLMVTRRTLGPEGFAPTKDWQFDKKQLGQWREQWAHLANRHLERHGHEARIDHRSLKEQGAEREPTIHLGYAANEMAQRGAASDRVDELQLILARNEIRVDIKALDAEMAALERDEAERLRRQRPTTDNPLDWTDRAGMVAQQDSALKAVRDNTLKSALEAGSASGPASTRTAEGSDAKAERLARLQQALASKAEGGKEHGPDDGQSRGRGGRGRTR
jgi:ATP-dependent exoDNAse (exonuclease V) alpha subunit